MTNDRAHPGRSVRTAVVWEVLCEALDEYRRAAGRPADDELDMVDLGGGTGGFAVPLARLGHRVTVVDPSPDALASLARRAAEAGVSDRVRAVQGDLATVLDEVEPAGADVVLCHGALEFADDPVLGCRNVVGALKPGGLASVLAANRSAQVLARALAGQVGGALAALRTEDGAFGEYGPAPRRFTEAQLRELLTRTGLSIRSVHGVRTFSDVVPANGETGYGSGYGPVPAAEDLLALESLASSLPEFRAIATQVHVLAGLD